VEIREMLPFRRTEHISSAQEKPILIESHCAFCTFVAISKDLQIVQMAEIAHHCPGIHKFRNRNNGKK